MTTLRVPTAWTKLDRAGLTAQIQKLPRRAVALWASAAARSMLPLFEYAPRYYDAPRLAVEAAEAFVRRPSVRARRDALAAVEMCAGIGDDACRIYCPPDDCFGDCGNVFWIAEAAAYACACSLHLDNAALLVTAAVATLDSTVTAAGVIGRPAADFGWTCRGEARAGQCRFLYRTFRRCRGLDRVAFLPAWRTADVVALARHVAATLDFDAMPVLADALSDAGCRAVKHLAAMRADRAHHTLADWAVWAALGYDDFWEG